MEAEEYETIFTLINDGTYIEGKKLFNLVVFQCLNSPLFLRNGEL
jgi:hypothetical protein